MLSSGALARITMVFVIRRARALPRTWSNLSSPIYLARPASFVLQTDQAH
jgi:hypothetical protein